MKESEVPPSPIGVCLICNERLFGPNIGDHYIDHHISVYVAKASKLDQEMDRQLNAEVESSGIMRSI